MPESNCITILNEILIITKDLNTNLSNNHFDDALKLLLKRNSLFQEVAQSELANLSIDEKNKVQSLIETISNADSIGGEVALNEKHKVLTELYNLNKKKFASKKYTENKL